MRSVPSFCLCVTLAILLRIEASHAFAPQASLSSVSSIRCNSVRCNSIRCSDDHRHTLRYSTGRDGDDNDTREEEAAVVKTTITTTKTEKKKKLSRWDKINPATKARIVQAAQQRAIRNKQKNESKQAKRRRRMMFVKEQQRAKKRAARVQRPVALKNRTLTLKDLEPGTEITGTVISLTPFGAYVDIGTECDGLLHISQMSHGTFVEHPRQVCHPGDELVVRVRSTNPEKKKLHLTLLPPEVVEEQQNQDDEDRIPLDDIQIDDELWGEIKRVTDYGAYVEVGAVVDGFLHFMDHPLFEDYEHPSEFMRTTDRVRVWVSDVDVTATRIKLTAVRPPDLPGPRRELV